MMIVDRMAFLKNTELFADIPEELLQQISTCMGEIQTRAGTTIFHQGEAGDAVYLVVDGTLRLESDGTLLVTRGPGECVGEFALIDEGPRSASVIAATDMVLLRWEVGDFQRTLARSPELTGGIFKLLTGKLRQDVQALQAANAALATLNRELEDRVQARTAALQQKTEELEQANRQIQEASERKSRFLTSMSHELRTPMNAIMGFTEMVLRKAGDLLPERHRDNLTKVIHSADRLLELINGLLDLSKIEAGRMDVKAERFDVEKLIEDCCAEVIPLVKPGVKLDYRVPDDTGEVHTDQGRLRQIIINLLSNALKYTEKGEVAVRVAKEGEADEEASLRIAVADTGAGIPAAALDTIFEEFQQVEGSDPQRKGTGLGLPITKGFAELLGGSVSVESKVGRGTTFMVQIPMVYREGHGLRDILQAEEEPGVKAESEEVSLTFPPSAELASLFELAQKGEIVGVREQIERIERLDARYLPFVVKVRGLARNFATEQICDFVKPHLG